MVMVMVMVTGILESFMVMWQPSDHSAHCSHFDHYENYEHYEIITGITIMTISGHYGHYDKYAHGDLCQSFVLPLMISI